MNTHQTFETERLLLRPTHVEDATFIKALLNTPKFLTYIGDRGVRTEEDAKLYIQKRMLPQLEKLGYGNYTIIRKVDGEKIGTCGLFDRDGLDGIDLGFAFLPEFEKMGYAFESAVAIKDAALHVFSIKNLCAITSKTNTASQKLLTKLDFQCTGTTTIPDDDEVLLLFSL